MSMAYFKPLNIYLWLILFYKKPVSVYLWENFLDLKTLDVGNTDALKSPVIVYLWIIVVYSFYNKKNFQYLLVDCVLH